VSSSTRGLNIVVRVYLCSVMLLLFSRSVKCTKLTNSVSHVIIEGVLACLDGYMNIAMEQTEEFVDGQLKAKYGDCFIRGNNGEPLWVMECGMIGSKRFPHFNITCSLITVLYISSQKRK